MDVVPTGGQIFYELEIVHSTGFFSPSLSEEEEWQQVKTWENQKGGRGGRDFFGELIRESGENLGRISKSGQKLK